MGDHSDATDTRKRLLLACGNSALRAMLDEQFSASPDFVARAVDHVDAAVAAVVAGTADAAIIDDGLAGVGVGAGAAGTLTPCCRLRAAGLAGPILAIGDRPETFPEADAVLRPPIRIGILLTSLRAALVRRCPSRPDPDLGPYRFDPSGHGLVRIADGGEIRLTAKEAAILRHLCGQAGATVSRESLLDEVWGYTSGVTTHTVETHIYRLRRKIEHDPARPALLLTVPGGYAIGWEAVP